MGKWSRSLPKPIGDEWVEANDRAASALSAVASAMVYVTDGAPCVAIGHVRDAAAEVRAWRSGERLIPLDGDDVREHLRRAARLILRADEGGENGWDLRCVDERLRAAGELLQRQIDEAE